MSVFKRLFKVGEAKANQIVDGLEKPELMLEQAIKDKVEALFGAVQPIKGEMRVVEQCTLCGQMWCKRFIPYSFGNGAGTPFCMCYAADRNTKTITVEERTP